MADWEEYEKQIFDKLREDFPESGYEIIKNDHIRGQFSKIKRQVDISIKGKLGRWDLLGVVECKCWNEKVDVPVVDGFIGFLEDVKANLGIIITNMGFSDAARNRANVKDIRLQIVEFDRLDEYEFSFDICEMCYPDSPLQAFIDWHYLGGIPGVIEFGRCSWCGGINVKCQTCDCVTPIYEHDYHQEMECWGGCGLKFVVRHEYDSDGISDEWIEIVKQP